MTTNSGPWMIVGLGNPGAKYLLTRHNLGFMALDYLAKGLNLQDAKLQEKSLTCAFKWDDIPVTLVKPQTFMNLSGEAVAPLARYYKVPIERVLVVYDDLDLPFGAMKIKTRSGAGGHNGVSSIIERFGGSQDFPRIKIGIGRPADPRMDPASYVLQKFSPEENEKLPVVLNRAVDAMESILFEGLTEAMNRFNAKGG